MKTDIVLMIGVFRYDQHHVQCTLMKTDHFVNNNDNNALFCLLKRCRDPGVAGQRIR